MGKRNRNLLKLGFILVGLLILGYFYYYGKERGWFSNKAAYYAYYTNDAGGLNIGTTIFYHGVAVGNITSIVLDEKSNIKAKFEIDKTIKLPVSTIAKTVSGGLMGETTIELRPGHKQGLLAPGSFIPTQKDTSFIDNLTTNAKPFFKSSRIILKVMNRYLNDFNGMLYSGLLQDILAGMVYLNKNTGDFVITSGRFKGYAIKIDSNIISIDTMTQRLVRKNDSITNTIHRLDTTMQKLSEKRFASSLDTLRQNFRSLKASAKKLNDLKLVNDKSTYESVNNGLDSTKAGVKDVRDYPKSHWMSVFGKNKKADKKK